MTALGENLATLLTFVFVYMGSRESLIKEKLVVDF